MGDPRSEAGQDLAPTIEELIRKPHWSRAEARRIFEAAARGDVRAREAVIERLSPKCELDPGVFDDLHRIEAEVLDKPEQGLRRVRSYLSSELFLSPCERAQAWGIASLALRMLGDISGAESALEEASEIAGDCDLAALDNHRRTVLVRFAAHRIDEAYSHADSAVAGYRALGGPGHDLWGEGLARSLRIRGHLRYHCGAYHRALPDLGEALSITPPTSELFLDATFDLSATLAQVGEEEQRCAYDYVTSARQSFRRRPKSPQRARLDWLEGSLRWRLREDRERGKWLLKRAQKDFIGFSMPYEVSGVTADLLRTLFPHRNNLRVFLAEWRPRLCGFLPRELWTPFLAVTTAVETSHWAGESLVDRAIASFREAASLKAGIPPCLIV